MAELANSKSGHEDGIDEGTPLMTENGSTDGASAVPNATDCKTVEAQLAQASTSKGGFEKYGPVVLGLGAAISYITLSSSMILFNKFLLRPEVFPFPVTLTSVHMAVSLSMGLCLQRLCPMLYPAYPRVFASASKNEDLESSQARGSVPYETMRALLPFAPIAVCGAISLVGGNAAYQYASVSFLQMVKESHIVFVYVLMMVAGLEAFKFRMAAVIVFITGSSMVAVYGEIFFSWQGLSLQLLSGFCASCQIVLNNFLMTRSSVGKIDPLTLVLCTAPVMLVVLLPMNVLAWDARIPGLMRQWLPYLAGNALLAVGLQISAATLIWVCSGTGYALATVAKDLAIVAAAQVLLHESFTIVQVMGFAGSISGMVTYSAMKLYPEKFF